MCSLSSGLLLVWFMESALQGFHDMVIERVFMVQSKRQKDSGRVDVHTFPLSADLMDLSLFTPRGDGTENKTNMK